MVCGRIWIGGRSDLAIMRRDSTSKRNGYSSKSYIAALEECLLPDYEPGKFFLQDNARIHVSKATKAWFERHGIWVYPHPPHSPDLNPIEHVWKKIKEILHRDFPKLCYLTNNEANVARVEAALKTAWWRVPQGLIDNLIRSMPRRMEAVRLAKGWYTKY